MKLCMKIAVLSLLFLTGACGTPTRVYYWERQDTGANRFIQDHKRCIRKADIWPYSFPKSLWPGAPEMLDLRLRLKDGGIWGNFSPYTGAQPVFVNSREPSSSVIYFWYSSCMKSAGYKERRPYTGPME